MKHDFDVVVIGTGTAAANAAGRCAAADKRVAIIDELPFGGTCVLRGCDPKKILRRGPEVVDAARRMDGRGIVSDRLRIDWAQLVAAKHAFTDPVPRSREKGFRDRGMATFHGTARFTGRTSITVGDDRLSATHILIATGARPRPLDIPGEQLLTTSTEFMELERLPEHVLFVGGGFISFEFAHMAARAGAKVTVLTRGDRPLKGFDPDLVDRLIDHSQGVGIRLVRRADVTGIEQTDAGLCVTASVDGKAQFINGDLVVHGAGRVPAIDALDLEKAGVRAGETGIEVNAYLQSDSNPAVYAAGDVAATAGAPLTPVSSLEGKAAASNLLEGNHEVPDYTGIPSVVFTIPALARVGLLEAEARDQGFDFAVKLTDMSDWFSARRVGETHAAAKTLIEKGTGRILGAHLLGPESSELINLFALAMRSRLHANDLHNFISAYPTAASDIGYLI